MKASEVGVYAGGALVGTLAAYALYKGVGSIFKVGGNYTPALVELLAGGAVAFTLRQPFWRVVGGVMIAQGLLDLLYAGNVIAVEL